ncbi:MAG: hypothetical protein AAFV26_08000 [Pseudomonadota bacterium]
MDRERLAAVRRPRYHSGPIRFCDRLREVQKRIEDHPKDAVADDVERGIANLTKLIREREEADARDVLEDAYDRARLLNGKRESDPAARKSLAEVIADNGLDG